VNRTGSIPFFTSGNSSRSLGGILRRCEGDGDGLGSRIACDDCGAQAGVDAVVA